MDGMKEFPDKYFSLALCDPPYGLDIAKEKPRLSGRWNYKPKQWDSRCPDKNYFDELFRVSKNQVIFGGNYFPLPPSRYWIIWDKQQSVDNFADGEMAWTSFDKVVKFFRYSFVRNDEKIHITQKPVALYCWLLHNYAKPGDIILDTHVGSASSLIACEQMGFKYIGFEIDKEYYQAATERMQLILSQTEMFDRSNDS